MPSSARDHPYCGVMPRWMSGHPVLSPLRTQPQVKCSPNLPGAASTHGCVPRYVFCRERAVPQTGQGARPYPGDPPLPGHRAARAARGVHQRGASNLHTQSAVGGVTPPGHRDCRSNTPARASQWAKPRIAGSGLLRYLELGAASHSGGRHGAEAMGGTRWTTPGAGPRQAPTVTRKPFLDD